MPRHLKRKVSPTAIPCIGQAADVDMTLDATLATLIDIARVLTPIIGQHGVVALYKRSLFLCASRHRCLSELAGSTEKQRNGLHLDALHAALVPHSLDAVTLCSNDLLSILYQLLIGLIGASLAERLLRGVWGTALCGLPPAGKALLVESGL